MDLKAQFRFFFFSSKHTRSGSLRSGSAAGHPEAERSKGHWFIRLSSLPPLWHKSGSREGRGVSTEDNFGSEEIFCLRLEKPKQKQRTRRARRIPTSAAVTPQSPGPFLPALAALWLSSSSPLLSPSRQPFSHSGGGAVLPEKVRTQISRHFLYTASHTLVLRSRAARQLRHLNTQIKKEL